MSVQTVIEPGRYLEYVDKASELHLSRSTVSLPLTDNEKILPVHAFAMHAITVSQDCSGLFKAGRFASALILARVALEHGVMAQLVEKHPAGIQGITGAVAKKNRQALDRAKKVFVIDPELVELYESMPVEPPVAEFRSFKSISDAFIESDILMAMYGNLSDPIHPGNFALKHYLDQTENPIPFVITPEIGSPERACHAAAFAVAIAIGAFEDQLTSSEVRDSLFALGEAIGLPTGLTLKPNEEHG